MMTRGQDGLSDHNGLANGQSISREKEDTPMFDQHARSLSRRALVAGLAVTASSAAAQPRAALPPTTITTPPHDFGPGGAPTTYFTDPDVLSVDPAFDGLIQANTTTQRLWTGALWMEGPAWCAQGRYLLWSDIPNNRQMRWIEDDGRVSVFRSPSNYSNGNTFDFQGRQISCEHLTRRVMRYELDGSATVLADRFEAPRRPRLVHRPTLRRSAL